MPNSTISLGTFLPVLGIAIGAALIPIWINEYHTNVATQILFAILGAYSIWLMMRINLLSLGHPAFLGIGAYVTAILSVRYGWPFWGTVPVAGMVAALAALAFGAITLRLQGIYFAMMSFVLLEIFQGILRQAAWITGGQSGISGVPRPEPFSLFGLELSFGTTASIYWLALCLVIVTLLLATGIRDSAFGLKLKAIAASERLAESAGVSVFKHRLIILGSSAMLLGLCGPLIVASTRLASPSNYGLTTAIDWLVYAALGARLGPLGPAVVAAVLVTLTQVVFTQIGVYRLILYGLILILTVMIQKRSKTAAAK